MSDALHCYVPVDPSGVVILSCIADTDFRAKRNATMRRRADTMLESLWHDLRDQGWTLKRFSLVDGTLVEAEHDEETTGILERRK